MLSKKTRYAILALASLAREFGNGPIPISRIAGDEHIPQRFLEGILLELKNGGVLGSVRGKAGGYYLSRDPGEVTLCDVVTRFEGTAGMLACASGRPGCSCEFSKEESLCKIRASFADIHRKMTELAAFRSSPRGSEHAGAPERSHADDPIRNADGASGPIGSHAPSR